MRAYIAAYALLLGLLAYLVLSVAGVVPQWAEREENMSLEVVLVFSTIFGLLHLAVIVAATRWRGAARRSWFWLAGTLPALIFWGPDVGKITGMITQPRWEAFVGLLMLVSLGTLIVAAVGSYRDARRAPA